MSNIVTFPARGAKPEPAGLRWPTQLHVSAMPPQNVRHVEFPVTGRQRASRGRNPLRHPCNRVSLAVTIAGRVQRGEPLGYRIDAITELRKGAAAAREVARALEIIADEYALEHRQ